MSKIFDVQDTLKTSLEGLASMANCRIVVDRQKKIDSEAQKSVAGASGFGCIIEAPQGRSEDREMRPPRIKYNISLKFFFKPEISDTAADKADDVIEDVIKHCHGLEINSRSHMCEEFIYLAHGIVDIFPGILSYQINLETVTQLS